MLFEQGQDKQDKLFCNFEHFDGSPTLENGIHNRVSDIPSHGEAQVLHKLRVLRELENSQRESIEGDREQTLDQLETLRIIHFSGASSAHYFH